MNFLLKLQIVNAAVDADRRGLPAMASVLTDALAEIERLEDSIRGAAVIAAVAGHEIKALREAAL